MIKHWWNGTFIPYDNDDDSGVFFVGGTYERHWSANLARAVAGFVAREWKWVIGTTLAVLGLAMTYARFF